MGTRLAPVLIALATLLAGCAADGTAGTKGDVEASQEPAPAAPVVVTETTGGIEGVVLDDEARPVTGITVELGQGRNKTVSDADGRYSMSGIEPGQQKILFKAVGWDTIGRTVDVKAGQVTALNVIMAALALALPYYEVFTHSGYIQFGFYWVDQPLSNQNQGLPTCEKCWFTFPSTTDLVFLLLEVEGVASIPHHGIVGETFFLVVRGEVTPDYISGSWGHRDNRSLDGGWPTTGDAAETFWVSNNCDGFWFCYDQRFTIHRSMFHLQGAPVAYSALPPE